MLPFSRLTNLCNNASSIRPRHILSRNSRSIVPGRQSGHVYQGSSTHFKQHSFLHSDRYTGHRGLGSLQARVSTINAFKQFHHRFSKDGLTSQARVSTTNTFKQVRHFSKHVLSSQTAHESWAHYCFRLGRRTVLVTYGILATIPACFAGLSVYYAFQPGQQARSRGFMFYAWTGFLTLPFSVVVLLTSPFVLLFDLKKRKMLTDIQASWARFTCRPFFTPEIRGIEHIQRLHDANQPVIYVSNHQSWLDIYSLFHLDAPILFVSKREVFYIPVAGWVMGLIGHIGVERSSKRSRKGVVDACKSKLEDGQSVFFFAEGTRSKNGQVQPFKIGAFKIAAEANVPVVPITISGTGKLMPPGDETWFDVSGPASHVTVQVHEPIMPSGTEREELETLRDIVRNKIVSSLADQQSK